MEMVTQAREAVDNKTPEVMEIDAKTIEEEINTIPEDKHLNRSKANSICYKCGNYGHYGKECTAEDEDLEEFANRIVGTIEHSFQAYTPVTLQYMNDIIAKAAKLDQSRRIAKTKAKLLQGMLNQRGGAQGVPKPVGRRRGRGVLKPHIEPQPQAQNQVPAVGRGRGRGGANFVAKKTKQSNTPHLQTTSVQPTAAPAPTTPQPSDPIKIEPNPFLSTNPFAQIDSHLREIHEIDEEMADEELEGLTLKELDALQQAVDQEFDEQPEDEEAGEEQ